MTDEKQLMMAAMNKFIYFSANLKYNRHEGVGYAPRFIIEAEWTCDREHMISKWREACNGRNDYSAMEHYYGSIDSRNRAILLSWVCDNYNDEINLHLDE